MITELKSIITLASTWVVVVKNDTEVCMYSILLSGFIEVKPALTPLRGGGGGGGQRKIVEDTIVKGLVPDSFLSQKQPGRLLFQPIASPPTQSRSF